LEGQFQLCWHSPFWHSRHLYWSRHYYLPPMMGVFLVNCLIHQCKNCGVSRGQKRSNNLLHPNAMRKCWKKYSPSLNEHSKCTFKLYSELGMIKTVVILWLLSLIIRHIGIQCCHKGRIQVTIVAKQNKWLLTKILLHQSLVEPFVQVTPLEYQAIYSKPSIDNWNIKKMTLWIRHCLTIQSKLVLATT
jgi:hypothetical protein